MREHAGRGADRHAPRAAPDGIRFAPQMIRVHIAIMPQVFSGEVLMTGYLISLAVIGLVVIAVSEDLP
jgi:hypothetical protein